MREIEKWQEEGKTLFVRNDINEYPEHAHDPKGFWYSGDSGSQGLANERKTCVLIEDIQDI